MTGIVDFTVCPQCNQHVYFWEIEDHLMCHEVEQGSDVKSKAKVIIRDIFDESKNGIEDPENFIEGIVLVLERYYTRTKPAGVTSVSLSAPTNHICSTPSDFGWGCGYRNIQMVMSSLLSLEPYTSILKKEGVTDIPDILKLQNMIEQAWSQGFDAKGCTELNGKVTRTKKWIGTTEAASVFRMLNIKAQVVDFARPTGPDKTHPLMFEWIRNYFRTGNPSLLNHLHVAAKHPDPSPEGSEEQNVSATDQETIKQSSQNVSDFNSLDSNILPEETKDCSDDIDYPPLYLQHEGHSRTVIGIEEHGQEIFLILLDPSHDSQQLHSVLMDTRNSVKLLLKSIQQFKQDEYEIVFIEGLLNEQEKKDMKVISPYQRFPST